MKEVFSKVAVLAAAVACVVVLAGCDVEQDHPSRMEESLKQQRGGMDQRKAMQTGQVPGNPAASTGK